MRRSTQLDHVVINVQQEMDKAQIACAELGFTVTQRGYHTLGSINHLMVFKTDYFELIGVPQKQNPRRVDLISEPLGINGLVFKTINVDETFTWLQQIKMDGEPPREFSRPVVIDGKTMNAKFRTVTVRADVFPAGRVYFCEHGTPDLVWRPEWQRHQNGAIAMPEVVITAEDISQVAESYSQLLGGEILNDSNGSKVLSIAGTKLTINSIANYNRRYENLASTLNGRSSIFGAIVFRTTS